MPYKKCELPTYPISFDMWDRIAEDERPKVIYGMGNGADKLFERLEKYNVKPAEVFASDGFVRGHCFKGYKVKSFSEIKSDYKDFLILLSFASNRSEVIEMISKIDSEYSMLIPDMPVAGKDYFDKEFYNAHYNEIIRAYDSLADEASKNAFASLINYKLSGEAEYLFSAFSDVSDIYTLLPENINCAIDAGAYNGDTVRELLSYRKSLSKIYAIEPDRRNFKKLSKFAEENLLSETVNAVNAAAWSSDEAGTFSGSGNRNSSVDSTVSYESRREEVPLMRIDSIANEKVDYIKLDVEGAEREALIGAKGVIERDNPAILISAYHRSEDIFSLINYMKDNHPEYSLYLRRTLCFPAWEIAVIATT